jgi:hypothetical protein
VSENQTHISEVSEIMARPRIVRPIRCSRRKALRKWKLRGNKVGGLYGDTESRFKLLIPDGIIVGHTPSRSIQRERRVGKTIRALRPSGPTKRADVWAAAVSAASVRSRQFQFCQGVGSRLNLNPGQT